MNDLARRGIRDRILSFVGRDLNRRQRRAVGVTRQEALVGGAEAGAELTEDYVGWLRVRGITLGDGNAEENPRRLAEQIYAAISRHEESVKSELASLKEYAARHGFDGRSQNRIAKREAELEECDRLLTRLHGKLFPPCVGLFGDVPLTDEEKLAEELRCRVCGQRDSFRDTRAAFLAVGRCEDCRKRQTPDEPDDLDRLLDRLV